MTSLERMMAAIRGEAFDKYPFTNPYPYWYMMPNWPELNGLTFAHMFQGSDEERLTCARDLHEKIGLDWLPVYGGELGADKRFEISIEDGMPVVLDKVEGTEQRWDEYPKDRPVTEPHYKDAAQVEAQAAPTTTEEFLAGHSFDMTKKMVEVFGDEVFLFACAGAPFASCYYSLGFNRLFDAISNERSLLHAICERATEQAIQYLRASAQCGVHGVRINDFFCSAELISEKDYLELVWPYEKRIIDAMREAGVVSILENLGWVEPRMPHIAKLEVDCLQTESSLKGYRNDVGEFRKVLGEEVCILGNSRIRQVIELGDEEVWRQDAIEQARGIGEQRRYIICAGSPTTWDTTPDRLRRYGEFTQEVLAELVPPLGA